MSELDSDSDEALFLSQARRGLSPTASARRRVTQALLPQLAAPAAPLRERTRLDATTRRAARSIGVASAIALSGGFGYFLGYHSGSQRREVAPVVRPVPAALVPGARPPVLPAESPALPVASAVRALPPPPSATRSASDAASARTVAGAARPREALGLDEEVRQLRRVERAIREENPRLALVLLEELAVAIPEGQLLEERKAASLMASCQIDAPAAQANARAFATEHAQSAYSARVVEVCRLAAEHSERISPAAGTSVPR